MGEDREGQAQHVRLPGKDTALLGIDPWLIDPYWAVEGFAGLSPRAEKDVFLGGLGGMLGGLLTLRYWRGQAPFGRR